MCTLTTTTVFLRVCALGIALAASPALAQSAAPADAAGQAPTQPTATGTPDAAATEATQATETAETATPATSTGPTAISRSLAAWVHAVGARICTGPQLHYGDRVCLPNLAGVGRGWRFSVPSFADARVSTPPARAHDARAADPGATTPTEPTEPVSTASEPAGN